MEVYLVRHTETVCEKGICYGQSNVDIKKPYAAIFKSIVAQLPLHAIIYSSPLLRCLDLANYIQNQAESNAVIQDARLMEVNFGDWEMQKWDAIAAEDLNPWMDDFVTVRVPNGESFTDLHQRVIHFMQSELQTHVNTPIIIVAHAGVIRSFLCAVSALPLQDAFQNKVDFGAVIKIEL